MLINPKVKSIIDLSMDLLFQKPIFQDQQITGALSLVRRNIIYKNIFIRSNPKMAFLSI